MSQLHLVRVGALGNVGRFAALDSVRYPRGTRVITRTARGLEIGRVLASAGEDGARAGADGAILRGLTVEDELLQERLTRHRERAYRACAARLEQLGLPVALMDVEHHFDGQTLVFYFLGESTPELEALTAELAELYETKVQFRRFAETVVSDCGPGCGTEDAAGQGCGTSCGTSCAISGACGSKSPVHSDRIHAVPMADQENRDESGNATRPKNSPDESGHYELGS